jgi:hypothetical protein
MSQCNFTLRFTGSAADTIQKVRSEIQKQNGNFDGDETSGAFDVKVLGSPIKGSYQVAGSEIGVSIEQKPIFISCDQIRSFMQNYM